MRFLDRNKIPYEYQTYECDEFIDGIHSADKIGAPYDQSFKTLVMEGKSGGYFVFVVPIAAELDLKKSAKAVGEKSVEMLHVKEITKVTGYVRGGCTAIGMKKQFRTVIHESAASFEKIFFSGGKIGFQVEVRVEDLKKVLKFDFADIAD